MKNLTHASSSAAAGAAAGVGGAHRGADPYGEGDEEGNWEAAGRFCRSGASGKVGARSHGTRNSRHLEKWPYQNSASSEGRGGGATGTERKTHTYLVAGGVDCSSLACNHPWYTLEDPILI